VRSSVVIVCVRVRVRVRVLVCVRVRVRVKGWLGVGDGGQGSKAARGCSVGWAPKQGAAVGGMAVPRAS
jgi:hypothetical protein